MDRTSPQDLRLFTYNVNWDAIFPDGDPDNHSWREADNSEAFRRLIAVTAPDIACIQEINPDRDPGQVSAIFDEILPLDGGEKWQAISDYDTVIVSKYTLQTDGYELYTPNTPYHLNQAAALVDLPDEIYPQNDFYLICAHFKSSGDQVSIATRQNQADTLIRQAGDLKTPGDYIDLPTGTPFVFAGDFNVYDTDPAHHLETLVTGDIVYEEQFGGDVEPDWDDTWLTDALPSHQGEGEFFYTWRDDSDPYNPGALDRVIYSDSVMSVANSFVLDTTTLSPELLAQFNLEANDVVLDPSVGTYDHLPIIVDFQFSGN
jgi:hypothetical protein